MFVVGDYFFCTWLYIICCLITHYLIENSQAVKKGATSKKARVKRFEIQGECQETAVMVG